MPLDAPDLGNSPLGTPPTLAEAAQMRKVILGAADADHVAAVAPATPHEGMLWYDTTVEALKQRRGAAWTPAAMPLTLVQSHPPGTPPGATSASGTITVNLADPLTSPTIGGITYLKDGSGPSLPYTFPSGATPGDTAANLRDVINSGGDYGLPNPLCFADVPFGFPSPVITLHARNPGAGGNAIGMSAAGAGWTLSGSQFTGGAGGSAAPACAVGQLAQDSSTNPVTWYRWNGVAWEPDADISGRVNALTAINGPKNFTGLVTMGAQTMASPFAVVTRDVGDARYGRKQVAVKATSEARTTATLVDDSELYLPVDASSLYALEVFLPYGNTVSAAGIKVEITGPSGWSMEAAMDAVVDGAWVSPGQRINNAVSRSIAAASSTASSSVRIHGSVFTAGSAGVVKVRWAQAAANGSGTTLLKGANVTLVKYPSPLGA